MAQIETATPEQLEAFTYSTCRTIESMGKQLQEARAERDQARRWAAAWKQAAKYERWSSKAMTALAKSQCEENERLQAALGEAQMTERARCLNIISGYVLRTRVKPHGAVGQALDFIMAEMKGADHDAHS